MLSTTALRIVAETDLQSSMGKTARPAAEQLFCASSESCNS